MSKRAEPILEADTDAVVVRTGKKRKGKQELLDPRSSLPGAIKTVGGNRPAHGEKAETENQAKVRRQYVAYLQALVRHNGNQIPALAEAYGISEIEAERKQVDLHDRLVRSAKGLSQSELMRRYDLGPEVRTFLLRAHAFSPNPAVSLKAIDMLNDIDGANKAGRSGETFESWLALLVD